MKFRLAYKPCALYPTCVQQLPPASCTYVGLFFFSSQIQNSTLYFCTAKVSGLSRLEGEKKQYPYPFLFVVAQM